MASSTVYSTLRALLDDEWSTTTVRWENETFDVPEPTDPPATPAAWLAVELEGSSYTQRSIGSGNPTLERWVEEGTLVIYSLVQVNAGTLVARQNATAVANLLRGRTLSGDLRITDLSIGGGGPGDEDGMWWQLPVRINWQRG